MRWWGKAAAGTVGLAVFGPVGAALGVAIGHQFDRGLSEELKTPRQRTSIYPFRETLVECTFSIMGHVAMLDGKVSGREKRVANAIINDLQLESHRKSSAWLAFEKGTAREFRPEQQLNRLREIARGRPEIMRAFLDMQMRVALADGQMTGKARLELKQISRQLGISPIEFTQTEAIARMRGGAARAARAAAMVSKMNDPVVEACAVLGVEPSAGQDEVKRAYRRLMNRHHPDKIANQDLGEEAMAAAVHKTHEIRMAYETVMEARR